MDDNEMICNVVVLGKTGVGKSSLLNYLFGTTFEAHAGKPVTGRGLYEETVEVNGQKVRVYDSWGIEAGKEDDWNDLIELESKKHGEEKEPKDWFHAVIFCNSVESGRKIQIESDIVSDFVEKHHNNVIIAQTKADNKEKNKEVINKLQEEWRNALGSENSNKVRFVPVCSEERKLRSGAITKFGRDELIEAIFDAWFETVKNKLPSAIVERLKKNLDGVDKEMQDFINKSNKVDGRPEKNEDFIKECGKMVDEKVKKILSSENVKATVNKVIGACKKVCETFEKSLGCEMKIDFETSISFTGLYDEIEKGLVGRWVGYIFSFGIAAVVRANSDKYINEEKNRIYKAISSHIQKFKDNFDTDLTPLIKKFLKG